MMTAPLLIVLALPALLGADEPNSPRKETLEIPDTPARTGRLDGDTRGFRFVLPGETKPIALEPGMTIKATGQGPAAVTGTPPFRVDLGLGQRLSGRLVAIDEQAVRLADVAGEGTVAIVRAGVEAVIQRPGESLVLQEGFETIDDGRWTVLGMPEIDAEPRLAGEHSLRIPAGGTALTHRLSQPFASGRLEVAFHDPGTVQAGRQWFVDLTFRGPGGNETVRTILGWAEESLGVESPTGPALAVQRLARRPGWHRLMVKFRPESTEIAVDGDELAHGKGFSGPLTEVRLASYGKGDPADPANPVCHLDDLRLVKFAEPAGSLEADVTQDEVRLTSGDQAFGSVIGADDQKIRLLIDGHEVALPWGEASGIHFRRVSVPGAAVSGLLVRAEWQAGPGNDRRDGNVLEGALVGLTDRILSLATAYAGTVAIPRSRLTALAVVGRGTRIELDPKAHHLGDENSTTPPILDPPQPEGPVLERAFELRAVPEGQPTLVIDAVHVVGEAPDLPFAEEVRKGDLRTNLRINGEPFDYLNHHITTRNETPERVRAAIPRALLKPGKNVVRLEQTGRANDPNFLDDLGILGIAVEFAPPARTAGER